MYLIRILAIVLSASFASYAQTREDHALLSDPVKSVQIFPNPAAEFVSIKVDNIPASHLRVTLHNIIGNSIPFESEIIDEHELRIRVKDLSSGYYLIALKDQDSKFKGTYKFLKR